MNKLLTIIIPSYNMEKYLDRCLSSLVASDARLHLFEVLVINDGSEDRTSEIAHQYESRYPDTFRTIDKENGNYGSCVNTGLAMARGKYVKVLDADDYFAPGFTDYLSFLQKSNVNLVLTDNISVDEKGHKISGSYFPLPKYEPFSFTELHKHGITHLNHFNITYELQTLKEMGYHQTEGISFTDLEWSTLPISQIETVAYCPMILYCYLKGREGQSVSMKSRKKNMWMENQVVLDLARRFENIKTSITPERALLQKSFTSFYIQQIYSHYMITYHRALDLQDLISFDNRLLHTSKELYDAVTDAKDIRKFGAIHYVRDFRKKRTRATIKYAYYDACFAFGSFIRRFRHK